MLPFLRERERDARTPDESSQTKRWSTSRPPPPLKKLLAPLLARQLGASLFASSIVSEIASEGNEF